MEEPTPLDSRLEEAIRDRLQRIPIVDTLGIVVDRVGLGYCAATVPRNPQYDGVFESFHGGLLITIADSVACFAILTQTGPDTILTTTDMNIRFLAPCLTSVRAIARTIKVGRSLCPVAIDLYDLHGNQVAVAQVTYMRLERMPSR